MGSFIVESSVEELGENLDPSVNKSISDSRLIQGKSGNHVQVVEFILGDELFAVDLFDTREVITSTEVTALPSAPEYVTGIIDLRGVITTIIDLKLMMHITKESSGKKRSRIIVLDQEISEKRIGILIDDVLSVSTVSEEDIDRTAHGTDHDGRDILGVIRKHKTDEQEKGKLVLWLDIRTMIRRIEKEL